MAYRDWIHEFQDRVQVIDKPVSRDLEVTRLLKGDPKTVFHFTDLDGHEAVGNLWATRERIARALHVKREDLLQALLKAIRHPVDTKPVDTAAFLKHSSTDFDLADSPVPKWYPRDAGRYFTSAVFVAEWQGVRNLSFHRILVLGPKRGAARIVPRHLYSMIKAAKEAGEELRVAVLVGVDPWVLLGGGTSLEYGADESRIASALRLAGHGKPLEVVRLRNGITVPAEAEFAFEARFTGETHAEGPFVDAVQTYDVVRQEPVLEFERAYHREDPVYHLLLSGGDEHFQFMGMPREPLLYEGVSRVVPHVRAVRLTEGGCAWLHGVVSIRKQHDGDGKNAIQAAFAAHTSMKQVIVVDEDIDVFDDREVEWAVATRFQADRGLVVLTGARGSSIDPSRHPDGTTAKLGIDATAPLDRRAEFAKARV
ncbi:MAG TPA: UbiD family decarboxylase [Thermoplasmata archaeon]|nr:UbiD family decarboxylase [Thermoplasmata archaeon]